MTRILLHVLSGILGEKTRAECFVQLSRNGCCLPDRFALNFVLYRTDNSSNHMGIGNYGFCSDDCPTVEKQLCLTVSGPASGSQCVFPFIFGDQTFTACAEWIFGGENQGRFWCSTK